MSFHGKKAPVNSSKVGNLQPCPNPAQVVLALYQFIQSCSLDHVEPVIPRDVFPALSDAVSAAIEIPRIPSPEVLEIVTNLDDVPDPVTAIVPVAVSVVFKVISPFASVTLSAPVYVMVYVTGLLEDRESDGEEIEIVGAVLSTLNTVEGPAATTKFPAVSEAVLEAIVIPNVPSPVILEIVTVLVDVLESTVTAIVPVTVPVVFKVMSLFESVTVSAPVYVMV